MIRSTNFVLSTYVHSFDKNKIYLRDIAWICHFIDKLFDFFKPTRSLDFLKPNPSEFLVIFE